jgi:NitT/TauT family transport system permease protein
MFISLAISFTFAVATGYWAATSRRAEKVLLPLLDICQSVPVLGFLAASVGFFMALFPGSLLGLECASIFAVFTSQAWNMAFSFYQSMIGLPADLRDSAASLRLTWWQRFTRLYLPNGTVGLVWNAMISFGVAWFFLAASEAFLVMGQEIRLPGIGSYVAEAVTQGDTRAMVLANLSMAGVIIVLDQFLWRPLVAWSSKFRTDQREGAEEPYSVVLLALRRSALMEWFRERVRSPLAERTDAAFTRLEEAARRAQGAGRLRHVTGRLTLLLAGGASLALLGWAATQLPSLADQVSPPLLLRLLYLGFLSMLRIWAMILLVTLIWVPVGVWIGRNPKVASVAQPLIMIGASFPINLLFPAVMLLFLAINLDISYGTILLLALATQWYVLSNVIVGASTIPAELEDAARVFKLSGLQRWRRLILPTIFPYWVTGGLAAAGGAWNATIVAEAVRWGDRFYVAPGLGSYLVEATNQGFGVGIILSITVMSLLVIATNHLVWQRLYRAVGEGHAGLES